MGTVGLVGVVCRARCSVLTRDRLGVNKVMDIISYLLVAWSRVHNASAGMNCWFIEYNFHFLFLG